MRRQHLVASIVTTIFTFWCSATMASDFLRDDVPLKSHWEYYATIKHIATPDSPPTRDVAMGPSAFVTPGADPTKAIYLEWFRADFQDIQPLAGKTYKTEYMLVKFDCQRRIYRVMRDVKYGQDGSVVQDNKSPSETKPFKIHVDGDTLPLAEEFASTGYEFLCDTNGD